MAQTSILGVKKRSHYKYTLEVEVTIFAYPLREQMEERDETSV